MEDIIGPGLDKEPFKSRKVAQEIANLECDERLERSSSTLDEI